MNEVALKPFIQLLVLFLIIVEIKNHKLRFSLLNLGIDLVDPIFGRKSFILAAFDVNPNWFVNPDAISP